MKVSVATLLLVAAASGVTIASAQSSSLVVHEWGTFTSFQDADGNTVPGINVDDEPVPDFVHRLTGLPIFTTRSLPARWSQGAPRCHPDVTLRLETPVLYFYPGPSYPAGQPIDVSATFAGGWLTEFYPYADSVQPGFPAALDATRRGSLHWKQLKLGSDARSLPGTQQHVWLAPRKVESAVITEARRQEAERYLFYRGVGHLDAPIVVKERDDSLEVTFRDARTSSLPALWVVRVMPDGKVRYRMTAPVQASGFTIPIPEEDNGGSHLDELQRLLMMVLVGHGLYRDEARAMLATWKLSYFESEGIRVMFVLPREWTDENLPLTVSVPADIRRVMLGRVELVSPHQRAQLQKLLELPAESFDARPLYADNPILLQSMRDKSASHSELHRRVGREVPESLQLYEKLGRFRDAWLAHEWHSADAATRTRLELIMRTYGACVRQ